MLALSALGPSTPRQAGIGLLAEFRGAVIDALGLPPALDQRLGLGVGEETLATLNRQLYAGSLRRLAVMAPRRPFSPEVRVRRRSRGHIAGLLLYQTISRSI